MLNCKQTGCASFKSRVGCGRCERVGGGIPYTGFTPRALSKSEQKEHRARMIEYYVGTKRDRRRPGERRESEPRRTEDR